MIRTRRWLALATLLFVAACDAAESPILEPDARLPLIQDARDSEFTGSGVFVLPPISDNTYQRTAPFDIEAQPRVEICRLGVEGELTEDKIEAAECLAGGPEFWFERDAAHDGETFIQVTPEPGSTASDSMFSVGWKTATEDANEAFRGTILLPKFVFDGGTITVEYRAAARFDVALYDNASTQLDDDRIVGYNAGQNFPVKFIVEVVSGCDGLDCFAFEVTCQEDVYRTDHAGVFMPEDWEQTCDPLDPGPEQSWWLIQERLAEGSTCVPADSVAGIAYEPCYVWQLLEEIPGGEGLTFEPYTDTFALPVTVQFCNNEADKGGVPDALLDFAAVFRYSDPPGEVALAPESPEPAFENQICPYDGEGGDASGSGNLTAFLDRLVRPVLGALGIEPRPLYAGDTGTLSAKTVRMSHFQRFVRLELDAVSSLSLDVVLGASETVSVRLTSPPHGEPFDGPSGGVPDQLVQFAVSATGDAGARLAAPSATQCGAEPGDCIQVLTSSDSDPGDAIDDAGYAAAVVTTSGSTGAVTIEVTFPGDADVEPVRFTLEVVDLVATFLEPLDTGDFKGSPDERFRPTVLICPEGSEPCDASSAITAIGPDAIKLVEENGRKFYQADWKPRDTGTEIGATVRAQIVAEEVTVGYSIPVVVTKGGKGERVGDVYYNGVNSTLPIKFTITRVDL